VRQTGIPACFSLQRQPAESLLGAQARMPVFRTRRPKKKMRGPHSIDVINRLLASAPILC